MLPVYCPDKSGIAVRIRRNMHALFVFCNSSRDRLKILEWDGDGFWLYFKRLERRHFRWPAEGDASTMVLNANELTCLIDGARLEKKLRRKEVFERQIS